MYATTGGGDIYTIDANTGAATFLGSTGFPLNSLDFCGSTLYGWGDKALITIDRQSAHVTAAYPQGVPAAGDLMCSPSSSTLYGIAGSSDPTAANYIVRFVFGSVPGIGTIVSNTPVGITLPGSNFYGGEIDGQGNMFVARASTRVDTIVHVLGISLYQVDLATQTVTLAGRTDTPLGMYGLATFPAVW